MKQRKIILTGQIILSLTALFIWLMIFSEQNYQRAYWEAFYSRGPERENVMIKYGFQINAGEEPGITKKVIAYLKTF